MIFLFLLHNLCYAEDDDQTRAEELYKNGYVLYEEGEFASAVLAWESGYEMSKLPAFLKNIALAHEANNDFDNAIIYLKKYRAFANFEEQEELKTWLTELESKQSDQLAQRQAEEVAAKEAAEKSEQQRLEAERIEREKKNAEQAALANQQNHPLPEPQQRSFPIWSTVGTGAIVSLATASTLRTSGLYQDISSGCNLVDGKGLCTNGVQENDLINQFEQSQTISLALWGASIAGAGLTVWQVSKPVQTTITPTGVWFGGQF